MTPDITVRGAGIFGLCIAYEAAKRGAAVQVIDKAGIGAGSSGGFVGALAPHAPDDWKPKKALQLESLQMAQVFWASVEQAAQLPTGYARIGRLQPIANARAMEMAQMRAQAAQTHWGTQALWRVRPATNASWEPASRSGFLIEDTLSARLHPRMAIRALAGAITSLGGRVIVGDAPDSGAVIWAAGTAGLADLSQNLGRKIGSGVKGQAILLAHNAASLPQIYADNVHIVPHCDGTVAVGSTSENKWQDDFATDQQLDALLSRACAIVPVLQSAPILERWAGIRPRAMTLAPILGPWPARDGHFVANGGFKIGLALAPKIASLMVDLVLDGRNNIPREYGL